MVIGGVKAAQTLGHVVDCGCLQHEAQLGVKVFLIIPRTLDMLLVEAAQGE